MRLRFYIATAAALVLAGCSSNASRISGLPPAPAGNVTAQRLPPPSYPGTQPAPGTVQAGQDLAAAQTGVGDPFGEGGTMSDSGMSAGGQANQQIAAAPSSSAPPTKEDVLGQWSIAAGGETCQIVVSLTGWQGGHRASTRGCATPELKNIGAWNVEGNYVVLKDNDGNALGRLASAGGGYQGRLELGGSVAMNR